MSNARNLSNLLSSTGDVKTSRLSNVPPADLINDTSPQLGGDLDLNSHVITGLSTDLVSDTSPQLGGTLDCNGFAIDLGNWTITETSGVLYFATSGTNKMKLDASGNLTVVGDVTASGTI
jgi:hypothetical protein